jgi:hypothetical protein
MKSSLEGWPPFGIRLIQKINRLRIGSSLRRPDSLRRTTDDHAKLLGNVERCRIDRPATNNESIIR